MHTKEFYKEIAKDKNDMFSKEMLESISKNGVSPYFSISTKIQDGKTEISEKELLFIKNFGIFIQLYDHTQHSIGNYEKKNVNTLIETKNNNVTSFFCLAEKEHIETLKKTMVKKTITELNKQKEEIEVSIKELINYL